MSRIYVGVNRDALETFRDSGEFAFGKNESYIAQVQTQEWVSTQLDQDAEVLEDALLQLAGKYYPYVVVFDLAQAEYELSNANLAQAFIIASVARAKVQAFFAVDSEGDFLWFGPTELTALLELSC